MIITLAEAKAYLNVTSTANDTILTTFVNIINSEIETVCGQTFSTATYTDEVLHYETEYFDLQYNPAIDLKAGRLKAYVKNIPIQSISSLSANGTALTELADYLLDEEIGEITFLKYYDAEDNTLKVTYVAGYTNIPEALKLVAYEGVKLLYQNYNASSTTSKDVESKSVGDFSVKYKSDDIDSSGMILKRYLGENLPILNKFSKWEF